MIGDGQFDQIERLKSKGHPFEKSFRQPREMFKAAMGRVIDLDLITKSKQWILDVGSRVPYFAVAADLFGHHVTSIDRADPLVERAAAILGADFCGHEVTIDSPLPILPHGFDLITCFGLSVRRGHQDADLKGYAKVIDAMLARLNPHGKVVVGFRPEWLGGRWALASKWRRALRKRTRITACDRWMEFEPK